MGAVTEQSVMLKPSIECGLLLGSTPSRKPATISLPLQLLTLILTITLLPESRTKAEEEESRVGLSDIVNTLRNQRTARILWQKLALSLALYGWYAIIALYLQRQLNFGVVQTTEYFSGFALVNVVINGFGVGKASNRLGDRTMSTLGLVLLVIGFATLPFVHHPATVAAAMVLFALGNAFAQNGITALISNTATSREQGTVLGVSSSLDSLSGIIAPPISTGLLSRYGAPYGPLEPLVLATISLFMGLAAAPNDEKYVRNTASLPEVSPEA